MADINVERKKGPGILPWILGLLLLAALIFGISRCSRDEDPVPVAPVTDTMATDTTAMAPAPAPMDTGAAAMGAAGAAGAAAAGGMIPVAQLLGTPDASVGQSVSGSARVTEVVSDRGFWIEEGGQRMFVVMGEPQAAENRIDVNAGQTVRLSGTVQRGGAQAAVPTGIEAEAQKIAQGQPLFLVVQPQDVQIEGAQP